MNAKRVLGVGVSFSLLWSIAGGFVTWWDNRGDGYNLPLLFFLLLASAGGIILFLTEVEAFRIIPLAPNHYPELTCSLLLVGICISLILLELLGLLDGPGGTGLILAIWGTLLINLVALATAAGILFFPPFNRPTRGRMY